MSTPIWIIEDFSNGTWRVNQPYRLYKSEESAKKGLEKYSPSRIPRRITEYRPVEEKQMEPNQNPPSNREWSIEEREEFFASQDAVTGIFGNCAANNGGVYLSDIREFTIANLEKMLDAIPKQPPIEWSTSEWNGPLIELDPDDPFGDMERRFNRGIHITSIVPPESGWPIVAHCGLCHKTEIVLSPWAVKPEKGDYWKMEGTCLDEEQHIKHNMYPQKHYPWKEKKDGTR